MKAIDGEEPCIPGNSNTQNGRRWVYVVPKGPCTAGVLNEILGDISPFLYNHEGKQHKVSYTLSKATKFCGGEGNIVKAKDFKVGDIVTILAGVYLIRRYRCVRVR